MDTQSPPPLEALPVPALLDRAAKAYGDRPALLFEGRHWTYAQLAGLVDRATAGLQRLGLQPGDRLGLCLPNTPYFVIFYYAALKAGLVVVNYNPLYVARELRYQIEDSGTELMVTLDHVATYPKLAKMLGQTCLKRIIVCAMADILPFPKNLLYPVVKRAEIAKFPRDDGHVAFRTLAANDGNPAPITVDPIRRARPAVTSILVRMLVPCHSRSTRPQRVAKMMMDAMWSVQDEKSYLPILVWPME